MSVNLSLTLRIVQISLLGIIVILLLCGGPSINPSSATEISHAASQEWVCTVTLTTVTTLQAIGGKCAAPGVGQSLYITDIVSGGDAMGTDSDSFNTLKYGTGGACGTGTTTIYGAKTNATLETWGDHFQVPIKIPPNNELCWINTTVGSKFWVITGFIAPG